MRKFFAFILDAYAVLCGVGILVGVINLVAGTEKRIGGSLVAITALAAMGGLLHWGARGIRGHAKK